VFLLLFRLFLNEQGNYNGGALFFILKVVGFGIASKLLERNILLNKGIRILIQIIIDAKNETRVTVKMKAGQS
jgi:hypothetical protein